MNEITILMVDDDVDMLNVIETRIKSLGYDFVSTTNSKDFLSQFKSVSPSLCIIDLNIEDVEAGFRLVETLKNDKTHNCAILVMSGSSEQEKIAQAIELGADDYIIKPPMKNQFMEKIAQLLKVGSAPSKYYYLVPDDSTTIKVKLTIEIDALDDSGFRVRGTSFIPKGTVVHLKCPLIQEILNDRDTVMVTAVSNWAIPGTKEFGAFLEVDEGDKIYTMQARTWLAQKGDKKNG